MPLTPPWQLHFIQLAVIATQNTTLSVVIELMEKCIAMAAWVADQLDEGIDHQPLMLYALVAC